MTTPRTVRIEITHISSGTKRIIEAPAAHGWACLHKEARNAYAKSVRFLTLADLEAANAGR